MSALPKSVQQQVKKANDIIEQINKPPEDPKNPPADPPKDPPADPPKADDPPKDPPADPPADPPEPEGWEHKYKVLQGKYNAEVPRLKKKLDEAQDQNRELRQRVNNVETTLASLQATRRADPPADPPKPKDVLTPEEIETFGPDLVDVITRVAAAQAEKIADQRVGKVSTKVKEVEENTSQVSRTVAQSRQERTFQLLADAVPNWAEQNEDEGFLEWLDETDPYGGKQRGVLLREAFAAHDAQRVIAFFKGYQAENAAVQTDTTPPTPPADPPKEPQAKLEEMVAPGAPKAPTAGAPNEAGKKVWTQKEVANLYRQKNEFIRRQPGKELPEELQKAERDLFKAQREGRIQ